MPKRNAVLMVVLAVAVIAAMGFLVLRSAPPAIDDSARIEALLRKLGDPDSDLRREGESGLRTFGTAAAEPLARAAKSSDRLLAVRAAALLKELQPPPPVLADDVVFEILCSGAPEKAQRVGAYMVQLTNRGRSPVLVSLPAADNSWRGAWFEVEDDQGRQTRVEVEKWNGPGREGNVVPVGAGSGALLCWGGNSLHGSLFRPEARSVRFVYDASDPGYRAAAEKVGGGALLPPAKLVSKTFVLDVVR